MAWPAPRQPEQTVDSHTRLANKWLGLAVYIVDTTWPKTLHDLGYAIHGIEHTVRVGDRNVSPDIIMANIAAGHALVTDCKSGANVDLGQDLGYARMATGDLHRAGVPASIRSHTPIYAINEEHVGRIRGHAGLALVVFGKRRIYGIGDLGNADLTGELRRGVPLEEGSRPDPDNYPFSIRDTPVHIDAHVARAILSYLRSHPGMRGRSLATRALASAILREAHPLHALFSGSHRQEIRRAVARSIACQERRGAWWLGPAARGHRRACRACNAHIRPRPPRDPCRSQSRAWGASGEPRASRRPCAGWSWRAASARTSWTWEGGACRAAGTPRPRSGPGTPAPGASMC